MLMFTRKHLVCFVTLLKCFTILLFMQCAFESKHSSGLLFFILKQHREAVCITLHCGNVGQ